MNLDKENLTIEEVIKVLLATNNEGSTVHNMAEIFEGIEVFQRILNLG
jgi:hypothetical protein